MVGEATTIGAGTNRIDSKAKKIVFTSSTVLFVSSTMLFVTKTSVLRALPIVGDAETTVFASRSSRVRRQFKVPAVVRTQSVAVGTLSLDWLLGDETKKT
jgi:hypothetical protein